MNTFEPEFLDMLAQPNQWGQIMPSIMVLKTEEFKKKTITLNFLRWYQKKHYCYGLVVDGSIGRLPFQIPSLAWLS